MRPRDRIARDRGPATPKSAVGHATLSDPSGPLSVSRESFGPPFGDCIAISGNSTFLSRSSGFETAALFRNSGFETAGDTDAADGHRHFPPSVTDTFGPARPSEVIAAGASRPGRPARRARAPARARCRGVILGGAWRPLGGRRRWSPSAGRERARPTLESSGRKTGAFRSLRIRVAEIEAFRALTDLLKIGAPGAPPPSLGLPGPVRARRRAPSAAE